MWGIDGWVGGCVGCGCLGCVFCFCFCLSVVVVLVFCCGGSGVRQWWGGIWGVDGCWQRGWAIGYSGGGLFFYFVFLYI